MIKLLDVTQQSAKLSNILATKPIGEFIRVGWCILLKRGVNLYEVIEGADKMQLATLDVHYWN